jgi:hypothetical protein
MPSAKPMTLPVLSQPPRYANRYDYSDDVGYSGTAMSADSGPKLGHNGGPELEDDDPTGRLLFVKWAWTKAHDEAWKTPPMDILRFRVARAEAAGLTYREYMLQLLDTGRHPQAKPTGDAAKPKRPLAKPGAPDHSLKGTPPRLAAPAKPQTKPDMDPAATSTVDSRVGDARRPSPMTAGGLRKVHK